MKKFMKDCCNVLLYIVVFVVVSFLLDLMFGEDINNFDIIDKATTGLIAGILIVLLQKYEKKRFNNN